MSLLDSLILILKCKWIFALKVAKEKADTINERIGYPELLTNSIELSKEYQLVSHSFYSIFK